ncbi:MAG: hypothetical protein LUD17_11285 [Bacteroidales bacterium]|nr:hypothetical protein [Bacteroidales bacterium]
MKNLAYIFLVFIFGGLFFQSCKDKEDNVITERVPVDTITFTEYEKPTVDPKARTYSFAVKGQVTGEHSQAEVVYTLVKLDSMKNRSEIAHNANGQFQNIPGLGDKEAYQIVMYLKDYPVVDTICEPLENRDFPIVEIKKPLDVTEVQKAIMAYVAGDKNPYNEIKDHFLPNLKIVSLGLEEDDDAPKSLIGVFNKFLFSGWKAIQVTNIEMDENNMINALEIKVTYE